MITKKIIEGDGEYEIWCMDHLPREKQLPLHKRAFKLVWKDNRKSKPYYEYNNNESLDRKKKYLSRNKYTYDKNEVIIGGFELPKKRIPEQVLKHVADYFKHRITSSPSP